MILAPADLLTLRRLAAHYRARAPRRGLGGCVVCHMFAATFDRISLLITEHGEIRPEVDYRRQEGGR